MIASFKQVLLTGIAIVSFLAVSSSLAGAKGDWTETFRLKNSHWVKHTPTSTILDGFIQAAEGIDITAKSFNGMNISDCGLHLKTDSTRQEFVSALMCAGVYPAN